MQHVFTQHRHHRLVQHLMRRDLTQPRKHQDRTRPLPHVLRPVKLRTMNHQLRVIHRSWASRRMKQLRQVDMQQPGLEIRLHPMRWGMLAPQVTGAIRALMLSPSPLLGISRPKRCG